MKVIWKVHFPVSNTSPVLFTNHSASSYQCAEASHTDPALGKKNHVTWAMHLSASGSIVQHLPPPSTPFKGLVHCIMGEKQRTQYLPIVDFDEVGDSHQVDWILRHISSSLDLIHTSQQP